MARFRGLIQGGRGEASRLGHKTTGLRVEADGWNAGVKVHAYVDENDRDVFEVYETGGSHAASTPRMVARIVDGQPTELLPGAWGSEAR